MTEFVDKLPDNPEEGRVVWLSEGKVGFWSQYAYRNGEWIYTAGMAVPYIPSLGETE
jgi:hypothetical protein